MKKYFILILTALLLYSCSSTGEKKAKTDSLTLTITGENEAELTLPFSNKAVILGEAYQEPDDSWTFYTDSLEWFENWEKGWTEASFSLTGSVKLIQTDDSWRLTVLEEPVVDSVIAAQIRYKETKYYGDRSRDQISRRWTRIKSAAAFAQDLLPTEEIPPVPATAANFIALEQLLFPEAYGFSPTFPEPQSQLSKEERYLWGEQVNWDTLYSKKHISEELIPVRDSGTLYRDYREGRNLFLLALNWSELWTKALPSTKIIIRRKK
ncbi:MAG: hypothetical protein PQJ59_11570 [Spirochaetales bacterium]|nr:hypothetical protein [Spirochaetales bacterium]